MCNKHIGSSLDSFLEEEGILEDCETAAKKRLCENHGGTVDSRDAFFACDVCSRAGIDLCKCGSHARYFGEALMGSVSCESCDESIMVIGGDARKLWNDGFRCVIDNMI